MIGYLKGKVKRLGTNYLIIETNGVGYKVHATPDLLTSAPESEVEVQIFHKITEDESSLFGLPNVETLNFFELLLSVSGIGPKTALNIVSSGNLEVLSEAIFSKDAKFFSQMGGVGKKTAERIIIELQDKVAKLESPNVSGTQKSDLFNALEGLGYTTIDIKRIIGEIDSTTPIETQLKTALKLLAK